MTIKYVGQFVNDIFNKFIADFSTGYRMESGKIGLDVLSYHSNYTREKNYIEDLTNENDKINRNIKLNVKGGYYHISLKNDLCKKLLKFIDYWH